MSRIVEKKSANPSSILSFKDLQTLVPANQLSAKAVVYVNRRISSSEEVEMVGEILSRNGVTFVERDVWMESKLMSKLEKDLKVKVEDFPIVFFSSKYLGSFKEVIEMEESGQLGYLVEGGQPEEFDGVCQDCRDYKFKLFQDTYFRTDLVTCKACNGTGREIDFSSIYSCGIFLWGDINLYICLEAQDSERRDIYIICSLNTGNLCTQLIDPPTINKEVVIYGQPSMGCGVYNSTIILAGGGQPPDYYRDCITYMINSSVSYGPFLLMEKGKYKPLVFQLNNRLCVCDSKNLSIEFYTSFLKTKWRTMSSIPDLPAEVADYSCLVFGSTCLMSVPNGKATYINHCNYLDCEWEKFFDSPLPFTGVGTFYSQVGFDDFVMMYLKNGAVSVCQFGFSFFGKSQDLFIVDSSKGDGDIHGYFADFGKGCFCLTAFDKSYVYVYTFAITREGKQTDPLQVAHMILSRYEFSIDRFPAEGGKITSIIGCFAPEPNQEARTHAAEVAANHFKSYQKKVDDDYDPCEADNSRTWYVEFLKIEE